MLHKASVQWKILNYLKSLPHIYRAFSFNKIQASIILGWFKQLFMVVLPHTHSFLSEVHVYQDWVVWAIGLEHSPSFAITNKMHFLEITLLFLFGLDAVFFHSACREKQNKTARKARCIPGFWNVSMLLKFTLLGQDRIIN